MNDELKAALVSLIKDLQSAKDFTIAQAPDVVRQMVAFEAAIAWMGAGVALAAIVGIGIGWRRYLKANAPADGDEWAFSGTIVALFGIFPVCMACACLHTAIMATFAPKWFVVTKIMQMVH